MDYATQPDGTEYTYFNQTTWTQLMTDDVFTDAILKHLGEQGVTMEKAALRECLYATMLSDTRIVTTTVTTHDPEQTMKIKVTKLKPKRQAPRRELTLEQIFRCDMRFFCRYK